MIIHGVKFGNDVLGYSSTAVRFGSTVFFLIYGCILEVLFCIHRHNDSAQRKFQIFRQTFFLTRKRCARRRGGTTSTDDAYDEWPSKKKWWKIYHVVFYLKFVYASALTAYWFFIWRKIYAPADLLCKFLNLAGVPKRTVGYLRCPTQLEDLWSAQNSFIRSRRT